MAKDNEGFELFKKEFKRYQKLFGLMGYHIYFEYKALDDILAQITINQEDMAATVRLNSKPSKENKAIQDVKWCAKHEAIHLLIGRLEKYGSSRFISGDDLVEATEELATKLESLIPDLPDDGARVVVQQ